MALVSLTPHIDEGAFEHIMEMIRQSAAHPHRGRTGHFGEVMGAMRNRSPAVRQGLNSEAKNREAAREAAIKNYGPMINDAKPLMSDDDYKMLQQYAAAPGATPEGVQKLIEEGQMGQMKSKMPTMLAPDQVEDQGGYKEEGPDEQANSALSNILDSARGRMGADDYRLARDYLHMPGADVNGLMNMMHGALGRHAQVMANTPSPFTPQGSDEFRERMMAMPGDTKQDMDAREAGLENEQGKNDMAYYAAAANGGNNPSPMMGGAQRLPAVPKIKKGESYGTAETNEQNAADKGNGENPFLKALSDIPPMTGTAPATEQ